MGGEDSKVISLLTSGDESDDHLFKMISCMVSLCSCCILAINMLHHRLIITMKL